MKAKKCGMSDDEKHFRRLNYCGTCKTIGRLYGQKSRLLLNHDTVFLAEILTALSGAGVRDWAAAYQSFNCLNLPPDTQPVSLQFAATVNVILTGFKLADHLSDEKKRRYKFAQKAFSREFQQAEKLLTDWSFPLDEVRKILSTQNLREIQMRSLDELAFPTAQVTGVFFREGVKKIGRDELQHIAFEIGFEFGKLVYFVDAFEDYEKDFRRQQFNAFGAAFDLRDEKITIEAKHRIVRILHEIEHCLIGKIRQLPIPENQQTLFIARLSQNLQRKLKSNLPVLQTKTACAPKLKLTFSQKWKNASEKARNLTRDLSWQMPLVFALVFVFVLVAPAQSREAKSARECFDLSFNLMFLGAVLSAPLQMVAINRRQKHKSSWCDCDCCCCCVDCDGCDGCCEFEGCDCCQCDNCDCCQCSCD